MAVERRQLPRCHFAGVLSYSFQDIVSYLLKVTNFAYPICIPVGGDPSRISTTSLAPENQFNLLLDTWQLFTAHSG